jgi:hypothetical protein
MPTGVVILNSQPDEAKTRGFEKLAVWPIIPGS